jgi:hypothetical protein
VEHVLQIDDLRLDFDDQQSPRPGQPAKDVDGTSVAEVVEGFLGDGLPAGGGQLGNDGVLQGRVSSVEKASQLRPAPPQREIEIGLES